MSGGVRAAPLNPASLVQLEESFKGRPGLRGPRDDAIFEAVARAELTQSPLHFSSNAATTFAASASPAASCPPSLRCQSSGKYAFGTSATDGVRSMRKRVLCAETSRKSRVNSASSEAALVASAPKSQPTRFACSTASAALV